jgi:DNA polymerase-3 subunit delta
MKILPQQVDSFIAQPSPAITAALLYGPDNGLVKERSLLLAKAVTPLIDDPFTVSDFSYDALKDAPFLLSDSLAALSFTGKRRLVRVTNVPATLPPAVQEVIAQHQQGAFLILTSGELAPTSTLRKLFETTPQLAAIACYNDEGGGLRKVIEAHIAAAGKRCDSQAVAYLMHALEGDRLLITSELDKLLIYVGNAPVITLDDAECCISADPLEATLDHLCTSVAVRNPAAIQSALALLMETSVSPIAMLRTLAHYMMRLYTVKTLMAQGMPESQAMAQLRPPVFFKNISAFQQHVRNWSEPALLSALRSINRLEGECKKTGAPVELLCRHYVTLLGAPKKPR